MKVYCFLKKSFSLFMLSLFPIIFTLFGCASTHEYVTISGTTIPPNMARIIFKRDHGILGAAVPHIVSDKTQGIAQEGAIIYCKPRTRDVLFIEQGRKITAFGCTIHIKGIFYKKWGFSVEKNIAYTEHYEGTESFGLNQSFDFAWLKRLDHISYSLPFTGIVNFNFTSNPDESKAIGKDLVAYKEKAHIIGTIGYGDTLQWDRPAGPMIIEVLEPGGDKRLYTIEKVEAGKVTNILYHAPLGEIEINPKQKKIIAD